jgi:MYXO-CTERM domain-containing protein
VGLSINSTDCDDTNSAINPDGFEVCDNLDNNCDTLVDDEDPTVDIYTSQMFFQDLDGDGFGDPEQSIWACSTPPNMVTNADDCNDLDANSYPGAEEVPDDGVDQDCDGSDLQGPPADSDGDGLTDDEEEALGLDPHNPDSDSDGALDASDLNPLDNGSDADAAVGPNADAPYGFGCGCSQSGGPSGAWLVLPLLALVRRQTRNFRAAQ